MLCHPMSLCNLSTEPGNISRVIWGYKNSGGSRDLCMLQLQAEKRQCSSGRLKNSSHTFDTKSSCWSKKLKGLIVMYRWSLRILFNRACSWKLPLLRIVLSSLTLLSWKLERVCYATWSTLRRQNAFCCVPVESPELTRGRHCMRRVLVNIVPSINLSVLCFKMRYISSSG